MTQLRSLHRVRLWGGTGVAPGRAALLRKRGRCQLILLLRGGEAPMTVRGAGRPHEISSDVLSELVAHLRRNRTQLREEWVRPNPRIPPAHGDDQGRDLRRGDVGVRQLRGGAGDRQRGGPPGLRPQPLGADHSSGGRHAGGGGAGAPPPGRAGPVALREVSDGFAFLNRVLDAYEPAANRIAITVSVGFVAGAGAGDPAAAGGDSGAVDAGAAGPRAAPDPADHRA